MVDMDLIILGSLIANPSHGYQLKQHIESTFGNRYFKLSNSALYPRLSKLEQDGFIEGKREPQDKMPDRIVYYITEAGMGRLRGLVATPPGPREDQFDFMIRATFFGLISKDERLKVAMPEYEAKCCELKEALEKREKYGKYMDKFSLLALDAGIDMIRLTISYYEKLMET